MRRIDVPQGFFAGIAAGEVLTLPEEQAHYARDVLRMDVGEPLELFDGQGKVARAHITEAGEPFRVKVDEIFTSELGESPLRTVLFQAIPKGKRWDWILEKATELGVDAVVPLETEFTVVRLPPSRVARRLARWEKIVASAARQCERAITPSIAAPVSIEEAIDRSDRDLDLVAHPGEGLPSPDKALGDHPDTIRSVGIWIGPEGGFSDEEVEMMVEAAMIQVTLGPRILRADTAGITALTLAQAAAGDLGASLSRP